MRKFCFTDTETTGFEAAGSKLVEMTYAIDTSVPKTLYFGVTLDEVPDFINDLIGFEVRGIDGRKSSPEEFEHFFEVAEGATMVAANPSFDKYFLKRDNLFPFHYRMLDIESYAMAKLNLPFVPGMKDIQEFLDKDGWTLTEPDHTSYNDVLALQQSFYILRDQY
jgi:DNA polymerase III alpha subunit (gram-positive type)